MRIRILRAPPDSNVDGIELSHFQVGSEYDLGHPFSALLVAEGWAEPLPINAATPPAPFGPEDPFTVPLLDRHSKLIKEHYPPYVERDKAADMSRRRPKHR